jgi:hypothetical protein
MCHHRVAAERNGIRIRRSISNDGESPGDLYLGDGTVSYAHLNYNLVSSSI